MKRLLFLMLALSGCTAQKSDDGCKKDDECDAGFFCQVETGACRCRSDDVCNLPGEKVNYCNAFGSCQKRPACLGNQDCQPGEICNSADASGGACIPDTSCGSSVHCDLGSFCSPTSHTCTVGCRGTGDCVLGDVCVQGQCAAGGTADDCTTCPTTPDPDPTYCDYGERCTTEGECVAIPSQEHLCDDCTDTKTCAGGLTCLLDPEVANGNYCAPTCERDLDCPSGYEGCAGLFIVTETCPDGTCTGGGKCLQDSESDVSYCSAPNADACAYQTGMCFPGLGCLNEKKQGDPCTSDVSCLCKDGSCTEIPGIPCTTGADCLLDYVVMGEGEDAVGACETHAKACGKPSGFTCDQLKNGTPACEQN